VPDKSARKVVGEVRTQSAVIRREKWRRDKAHQPILFDVLSMDQDYLQLRRHPWSVLMQTPKMWPRQSAYDVQDHAIRSANATVIRYLSCHIREVLIAQNMPRPWSDPLVAIMSKATFC
jgi:hypothetical protein